MRIRVWRLMCMMVPNLIIRNHTIRASCAMMVRLGATMIMVRMHINILLRTENYYVLRNIIRIMLAC